MSDRPTRTIVKRLKLETPIHDAGDTIATLEFGKPKARLYRLIDALEEVGGDQIIAVLADLCGVGEEAIEELDWDDAEKATLIVGELLNKKKKAKPRGGSKARKGGKNK